MQTMPVKASRYSLSQPSLSRTRSAVHPCAAANPDGSSTNASVFRPHSTSSLAKFMKRAFERWLGGSRNASSVCCYEYFVWPHLGGVLFPAFVLFGVVP